MRTRKLTLTKRCSYALPSIRPRMTLFLRLYVLITSTVSLPRSEYKFFALSFTQFL